MLVLRVPTARLADELRPDGTKRAVIPKALLRIPPQDDSDSRQLGDSRWCGCCDKSTAADDTNSTESGLVYPAAHILKCYRVGRTFHMPSRPSTRFTSADQGTNQHSRKPKKKADRPLAERRQPPPLATIAQSVSDDHEPAGAPNVEGGGAGRQFVVPPRRSTTPPRQRRQAPRLPTAKVRAMGSLQLQKKQKPPPLPMSAA
eukprot:COSAG06_NODE_383_length_16525_cov_86.720017_13_plen_202_part_00